MIAHHAGETARDIGAAARPDDPGAVTAMRSTGAGSGRSTPSRTRARVVRVQGSAGSARLVISRLATASE